MRYLSLINQDNLIVAQVETHASDNEAIALEEMLRKQGLLPEHLDLAITIEDGE